MAVTQAQLTELYLAYFGRPPDFNGVTFYTANPSATVQSVAAAFSASPESQGLYGATFGAAQINAIYQNLFGRDAEAGGLTYWATEVASGRLSPAMAAYGILVGAQGADKTAVANKVAIAKSFYAELDTGPEMTGYAGDAAAASARSFLRTVTSEAATMTAAQAALPDAVAAAVAQGPVSGIPGATFTLTVNQDIVPGTAGNDVFNAIIAQDGDGNAISTLQDFDSIDGGDGIDTLNVTIQETVNPTLKSVEVINARFTENGILDLHNAVGVKNITVTNSSKEGSILVDGPIGSLTVKDQTENIVYYGDTATTFSLNLDNFGDAAWLNKVEMSDNVTTLNVTMNNSYASVTGVASVKTATVVATGTNVLDLGDSRAHLESLTVTGRGSLDLSRPVLTGLKTLNASVASGNITAVVDDTATSVATGSGNDTIRYTAAIDATAKIDLGAGNDTLVLNAASMAGATAAGGEGTDTLVISDATWLTAGGSRIYSGFEVLEVGGGTGTYDMDQLTSLKAVSLSAKDVAGATTISNAAAGTTLTVNSAMSANLSVTKDLAYALKSATGQNDSLTLAINAIDGDNDGTAEGGVTLSRVVANGIESISIVSSAAADTGKSGADYTHTITALNADALKTLTISGAANTTITTLNATTVTKVDASAATGSVNVDASNAAQVVSFMGGTGKDTFKGTAFGDTYNAGKGADMLTLGAVAGAQDTIILKAGDSVLNSRANGHDIITNFGTTAGGGALDVIDATSFGFTGSQRAVFSKGALSASAIDGSTLNVADFFDNSGLDRGVAVGTNAGNTYVFIDVNKDGNFSAADDLVLQLNGVTDVALSNFAF
jgi:hypothetical protein